MRGGFILFGLLCVRRCSTTLACVLRRCIYLPTWCLCLLCGMCGLCAEPCVRPQAAACAAAWAQGSLGLHADRLWVRAKSVDVHTVV